MELKIIQGGSDSEIWSLIKHKLELAGSGDLDNVPCNCTQIHLDFPYDMNN